MKNPIIVALDVTGMDQALELVETLSGVVSGYKVGAQLLISAGPEIFHRISGKGGRVLLDLELIGTPNTVADAVWAAARLKVSAMTIHVSGNLEMMREAKTAADTAGQEIGFSPLIVGVTVATDSDDDTLHRHGQPTTIAKLVERLTKLAMRARLNALICPPTEVAAVRALAPEAQLMVRGIRLPGQDSNRHKQVVTPRQAMAAGADRLIIGRPIYTAKNPRQVAQEILTSLEEEGG